MGFAQGERCEADNAQLEALPPDGVDLTLFIEAYAPLRWWTCAGLRWSSKRRPCTSAGSSRAPLARILSSGTNYEPCGRLQREQGPKSPFDLPQSGARRSPPLASPAWSSGRAPRPSLGSRHTRTCSGTPVATRLPIRGMIPERFRLTWVIRTFNTRSATPSCRRRGSRIFGDAKSLAHRAAPKRKGWREKERGAALFVVLPTNCLTRLIATAKHRPLLRQLPST